MDQDFTTSLVTMAITFAAGCVGAAIVAGAVVLLMRSRPQWLVPGKPVARNDGAFRTGPPVPGPPRVQRRLILVIAGAAVTMLWTVPTLLLAIAGGLGWLVMTDHADAHSRWFWDAIGLASLNAAPMALALFIGSFLLLRRGRRSVWVGVIASLWQVLHHAGLVAVSVILALETRFHDGAATFTGIVASCGLVLSLFALAASAFAVRTD